MLDNYKILGKKALVEPLDFTKTESGIFIKPDFEPKTLKSKVVKLNEEGEKIGLKEGDIVLHHKFAGAKVELDEKIYKLVSLIDILAIEE